MAKDFFGKEIKVGDFITYPGRRGSSLWMNVGQVIDIKKTKRYWGSQTESDRLVVLKKTKNKTSVYNIENVIVMPGIDWDTLDGVVD